MVILYIGLGMAMISGISAMFRIANNIHNLNSVSYFKQSEYFQKILPSNDKKIMKFLNDYSGSYADVCPKVREELNKLKNNDYGPDANTPNPNNTFFGNSCSLVDKDLRHRVLINKNQSGNYTLFSCYLERSANFCSYELEPKQEDLK